MNIATLRIQRGLQQKDLMKDTGLFSKIENGKAMLTPEDSERIAKLFEVETRELFTDTELSFFSGLSAPFKEEQHTDNKLATESGKIVSMAVCKPCKRHLGFVRKCYWLNKTRNILFFDAFKQLGYKTAQEWFSAMVDETIEQAEKEREHKEYCNSDYMGKEEINE